MTPLDSLPPDRLTTALMVLRRITPPKPKKRGRRRPGLTAALRAMFPTDRIKLMHRTPWGQAGLDLRDAGLVTITEAETDKDGSYFVITRRERGVA